MERSVGIENDFNGFKLKNAYYYTYVHVRTK